jgi:hypothetical protein
LVHQCIYIGYSKRQKSFGINYQATENAVPIDFICPPIQWSRVLFVSPRLKECVWDKTNKIEKPNPVPTFFFSRGKEKKEDSLLGLGSSYDPC